MILLRNLRFEPGEELEKLRTKAAKKLRVPERDITDIRPVKRSLDARMKNDIHYTCSAAVSLKRGEERALKAAGKDAAPAPVTLAAYGFCSTATNTSPDLSLLLSVSVKLYVSLGAPVPDTCLTTCG